MEVCAQPRNFVPEKRGEVGSTDEGMFMPLVMMLLVLSPGRTFEKLEARGGIEPPIRVLQTHALPLGYRASVAATEAEEKHKRRLQQLFCKTKAPVRHKETQEKGADLPFARLSL